MLTPIRGERKPRRFSVYDFEWIPGNVQRAKEHGFLPMQLRLAGVYDGVNYTAYASIQDFLNGVLTPRNSGMWYYAHAGGLADIQFILEYLLDNGRRHGYTVSCAFSGSSAIIVRISKGKYFWNFLDSYWLLREKLSSIGQWMGLAKGDTAGGDMFYAPLSELIPYNRQDCVILYEAIRRLEDTVLSLGGRLEMTIASTAMSLFRRRYLTSNIHTDSAVNDIASSAYIASRVEVFERECVEGEYWDINSSFPYSMTFEAPGNLLGTSSRWNENDEATIKIVEASITVDDCDLPPVPYRTEDRRIYFPTGSWRSWFSEVDLKLLLRTGHRVDKVHKVLKFEPFHDLKSYSEEIYHLRKTTTDRAEKVILKYLLNSLYGKFAEGELKSQYLIDPPIEFFDVPEWNHKTDRGKAKPEAFRSYINPGIWEYVQTREISHRHVPIAMHITSLSRQWLYDYMLQVPKVYYCDTDSIVCDRGSPFKSSSELGQLKFEGNIVNGHFHAPKTYRYQMCLPEDFQGPIPYTIKAKGISRPVDENGDTHTLNFNDYATLLEHKELHIEQFTRVKGLLRSANPHPHDVHRMKALRDTVNPKRCFPAGGGRSRPWTLDELLAMQS